MVEHVVLSLKSVMTLRKTLAEPSGTRRRGRLVGYFLGAVVIMIIGLVLVIKNRKKK